MQCHHALPWLRYDLPPLPRPQDIDQVSLFKPLCKFVASVSKVRDIVPTLKRAFQAAASGIPGPVFVEFAIDVSSLGRWVVSFCAATSPPRSALHSDKLPTMLL